MKIKFTKMHGLGNDFIVMDAVTQSISLDKQIIQKLSDRHFGIGFDQCLLVEATDDPQADFFYRVFNADGTQVEQCGNGARCILRFLIDQGLTHKKQLCLATLGGYLNLRLNQDNSVSVTMGEPIFEPSLIPFKTKQQQPSYTLSLNNKAITFHALSMGNPHAVIVVQDLDAQPISRVGAVLQKHPAFPHSVNVGFMQIIDATHIKLRVYERGSGETLACGSGACAAVVAGILAHGLAEQVQVSLPGGELMIHWPSTKQPVVLTGPAVRVYEGWFETSM